MRTTHSGLRRLAAAALLFTLAACGSIGDMLSPGKPAGDALPAKLALNAIIPRFQQSSFSRLELRVITSYLREDQSERPLGTQTIALTGATTQTVPVSLELGPCLTDPDRSGAATNPDACFVRLELILLGDGRELDRVQLLGLRLTPGATTAVPQTVELFEVASVEISVAGQSAPIPATGVSVEAGTTVALAARALDATNQPVAGRDVTWSSSNSAVASVSATGVVTAAAAGQATISASIGGRTTSVNFTVRPPVRRLSVTATPGSGAGRIVSVPAGIDCAINAGVATGICAFDFQNGASVTLTASFSPLTARFAGWTGACLSNGQGSSCQLVMDQPRATGASFTSLTPVTVQGSGSGVIINSSPVEGIACTLGSPPSGACTFGFVSGQTIVLTAQEITLARVDGWVGCDAVTRTSCTLSLAGVSRSVSVLVVPPRVLLGAPRGNGNGIVTSPAAGSSADALGLSCAQPASDGEGRCESSYPFPSSVTVTATPASGSRFVRWEGGGCENRSTPQCVVNLTNRDVVQTELFAVFEVAAPLTIDLSGTGGGNVFVNGAPACALGFVQPTNRCVLNFDAGATVTLTASPLLSGQFLGFGGACPTGSSSCTLTLTGPTTVTGAFAAQSPTVDVTIAVAGAGSGAGYVVSGNEDIACDIIGSTLLGPRCSTTIDRGTSITLSAFDDIAIVTSGLNVFRRWGANSPCPLSPEPECTFTPTENNTVVEVEFVPAVSIALSLFGDAGGQISLSVPGYRSIPGCAFNPNQSSVECEFFVPLGSNVTLTAIPESGAIASFSSVAFCSVSGNSCTFIAQNDESGAIVFLGQDDD